MDVYGIIVIMLLPAWVQGYTWMKGQGEIQFKYGCVLPPEPDNGYFIFDDPVREIGYKCDEGYNLTKPVSVHWRKCVSPMFFSGDKAYCYPTIGDRCPTIRPPNNGYVNLEGFKPGDEAKFWCEDGFILLGQTYIKCGNGYHWNGQVPDCRPYRNVEDYTELLKDKFIDSFRGASADSSGVQGKLSAGKLGLDIVFALDTSASVGSHNLELAKKFIMSIVKQFGISKYPNGTTADGGNNGTRIAVITFNEEATTEFELNDPDVRSVEAVEAKLKTITKTGGGTSFLAPLNKLMRFPKYTNSDKTRALFFVTDSENNERAERDKVKLTNRANLIKSTRGYEIFAIGIGEHVNAVALNELATDPYAEHVFEVKDFNDLETMANIIAEKNIDYGQCGISGDISSTTDKAKQGAWPSTGWLGVASENLTTTCGGTLLCDRWLITAAHCVMPLGSDKPVNIAEVNVNLGNQYVYGDNRKSDNGIVVPVTRIFVHPNYNETVNEYGVRDFDVALLYLGKKNYTRPVLNKFIRPMCFPAGNSVGFEEALYSSSQTQLTERRLRYDNNIPGGYVVGWGHTGKTTLWQSYLKEGLSQAETEVKQDRRCLRKYPNLDMDMFFCVGQGSGGKSASCHGDIGGPFIDILTSFDKRLTMLGIALDTDDCTNKYSIFLNMFHPEINKWVSSMLRNCSRYDKASSNSTTEDDEYEDEILQQGKFAVIDEDEDTGEELVDGSEEEEDNAEDFEDVDDRDPVQEALAAEAADVNAADDD